MKKILLRGACLSRYTLDNMVEDFELVDCEKQRVDYIVDACRGRGGPCRLSDVLDVMPVDEELALHVRAQEHPLLSFSDSGVEAIIMDSFSELVDAEFRHENGSRFFEVYSAVKRNHGLMDAFKPLGRLDLSGLCSLYDEFFDLVEQIYGAIPVVYLIFPSDFEAREEFIARHHIIEDAILKVAQRHRNVQVFKPTLVERNPNDDNPYHFSFATYLQFARAICASIPWLKLKKRTLLERIYERKTYQDDWRRITILSSLNIVYRHNAGLRKIWLGAIDKYAWY